MNTERDQPSSTPRPHGETTPRALHGDPRLTVRLQLLTGESGLDRPIRHPRVQKSGLALAGHFLGVVPSRVQVLGETELSYLEALPSDVRGQAARGFFSLGLTGVVVTRNQHPPRALVSAAEASGTPLFLSDGRSSRTINAIHEVLDALLAPTTTLHAVLVDVFGVGVLLLGKSGIGKSECALELVLRGHRLIADDVVHCDWRPPGVIFGTPASLLRHHIEVRGLGVLNVQALFGVTSVRERKRIDLVVRLVEWDERAEYDRLGLDDKYDVILGTSIRELTVPVRPGRDMGSILEIAARNELLRRAGTNSSQELMGRLEGELVRDDSRVDPQFPPAPVASDADTSSGMLDAGEENENVTWSSFRDPARSGESSAWIPAVRPRGGDE